MGWSSSHPARHGQFQIFLCPAAQAGSWRKWLVCPPQALSSLCPSVVLYQEINAVSSTGNWIWPGTRGTMSLLFIYSKSSL